MTVHGLLTESGAGEVKHLKERVLRRDRWVQEGQGMAPEGVPFFRRVSTWRETNSSLWWKDHQQW